MIILEEGVKEALISHINTYLGFLESCSEETRKRAILAKNMGRAHVLRINISHSTCSISGLSELTVDDDIVNLGQLILAVNKPLLKRAGGKVTLQLSKEGVVFVKPEKPIQQSHYRGG